MDKAAAMVPAEALPKCLATSSRRQQTCARRSAVGRKHLIVQGSLNNFTGGANWKEDYVLAHVVDAVSMRPLQGRLFMTLSNGRDVQVDHINPTKGRLLYRTRNPAIFLKVADDSDVLLPIVVGEAAVDMLMKALHNEDKLGRPNHYQLLEQIVFAFHYEARMVRITERVKDTYYARIYFSQNGKAALSSVDARPSDAVNFAVRCKVPIFVHKSIIDSDAVRPVYTAAEPSAAYLDSPADGPDPLAEEVTLLRNMLVAVMEERYADAARWRDQLHKLRMSLEGRKKQVQKPKGSQSVNMSIV